MKRSLALSLLLLGAVLMGLAAGEYDRAVDTVNVAAEETADIQSEFDAAVDDAVSADQLQTDAEDEDLQEVAEVEESEHEEEEEEQNEEEGDESEEDTEETAFLQEVVAVKRAATVSGSGSTSNSASATATDAENSAVAEDNIRNQIDALIAQEIEKHDADQEYAKAEQTRLEVLANSDLEKVLADANDEGTALLEAHTNTNTALDTDLKTGMDLSAFMNADLGNEHDLDSWLDMEFETEYGPHDSMEDPMDALIKDAPALPRDLIKIKPKKAPERVPPIVISPPPKSKATPKPVFRAPGSPAPKPKKPAPVPLDPTVLAKWKNIKDTTDAYLTAIRGHIASKYGKDSRAVLAGGVRVTRDVYKICLRFGRNKFLCAVLRDRFRKNFLKADVDLFSRDTKKRFIREMMKLIIKFTHHHKRHPLEFTSAILNAPFLKDPYTVCGIRMKREIRKFWRAVRYAVAEYHPHLDQQLVSDFNNVFAVVRTQCLNIEKALKFTHPLCSVLLKEMEKNFATKDVFNDRKVRSKFVRKVAKKIRRSRAAERKAQGLPKQDPRCKTPEQRAAQQKQKEKELAAAVINAAKIKANDEARAEGNPLPHPSVSAKATDNKAAKANAAQIRAAIRDANKRAAKAKAGDAPVTPPPKPKSKVRSQRHKSNRKRKRVQRRAGKSKKLTTASSKSTATPQVTQSRKRRFDHGDVIFTRVNAPHIKRDRVEVAMKLNIDFNKVAANPDDLAAFIKAFTTDTARALGTTESRIRVIAIQNSDGPENLIPKPRFQQIGDNLVLTDGTAVEVDDEPKKATESGTTTTVTTTSGLIVKFDLVPAADSVDKQDVDALSKKLAAQVQDPNSAMQSSAILSKTDPQSDVIIKKELATQPSAATALQPSALVLSAVACLVSLVALL